MPDPRDDYDYLYQVGENSYADPWNMRSLFGLQQDPRALTSQEEVNVTAPMPGPREPFPKNMSDIYLGTKTVPPTGTYTPPLTSMPTVDKELQPAWSKFTERHPFANNLVSNVRSAPLPSNIGGANIGSAVFVNDRVLPPDMVQPVLAHEATHAATNKQFPGMVDNVKRHMGGILTPYRERPGETTAYKVEDDERYQMFLDESRAKNAEYRREAEAEYRAGKRPRPFWMD